MNGIFGKETDLKGRQLLSAAFKIVIPIVITVGLCWLLFSKVDYRQMISIIRRDCDYSWIVLALVLSIFSHVFRAMRWRIQLRAIGVDAPLFALVLSIFGTYAVNLVFPRLGELWRTGYIAQRQQAPFDRVFGSMVADRLTDTLTVGLLTLATLLFAGGPLLDYLSQSGDDSMAAKMVGVVTSPWVYVAAIVVALIGWLIVRRYGSTRPVARLIAFAKGLWQGFAAVAVMPGRIRFLLLTVCIWGCYFLQLYVAFFAFPATAEVALRSGVGAVMVCFVLSSISMVVPSQGGIGPWQWAIVFGLSVYSAEIPALTTDYATAFANLVMGSQTLLLILLGIFTFIAIAIQRRRAGAATAPTHPTHD